MSNYQKELADGYYLTAYLSRPGIPRLLDCSVRHDHNVSLWRVGDRQLELVRHWELERFSGSKNHGVAFRTARDAREFIAGLLDEVGVKIEDLNAIWGTPGLTDRVGAALQRGAPHGFPSHSFGHLWSGLVTDSDRLLTGTTLAFAVDDTPDWTLDDEYAVNHYLGAVAVEGAVHTFPVESPGKLYSTMMYRSGLREGTLMALATASTAEVEEPVWRDHVWQQWFGYEPHRETTVADDLIDAARNRIQKMDDRFTDTENLYSAVMKQVQALSVHVMERNVRRALDRFELAAAEVDLCITGGYALNCPTNSHLMEKFGFRSFATIPAVNDGGQAIGLGLGAFRVHLLDGLRYRFPGAYIGRDLGPMTIDEIRHLPGVRDVTNWSYATAVADIEQGPVAWVQGAAEIGPRALGNRSILADPRAMHSKDELNRIKRRQWWRPVAPVVLEERAAEWFAAARPSPYMLETFELLPERRPQVEAIAHLDATARIQTVNRRQNQSLAELLEAFERATGVPMLCNTSLNDKDEPIVQEPAEAVAFCRNRGVRTLYLGRFRVTVEGVDGDAGPAVRSVKPFVRLSADDRERGLAEVNPHDLDPAILLAQQYEPEVSGDVDISNSEGAVEVERAAIKLFGKRPETEVNARKRVRRPRYLTADGRTHFAGSRSRSEDGQLMEERS